MRNSNSLAVCLILFASIAVYADKPSIEGTYWRLSFLTGIELLDGDEHLAQRPHIALHSEANRVAGFSGCNRFFAQYAISQSEISFQILGGGRASCADNNELEASFFRLLSKVTHYELSSDELVFYESGELSLRFVAVITE